MDNLAKKFIRISSFFSVIAGLVIGAFMMYAAWDHNPSGEIHSDGIVHWVYWFEIGASWFIAVGLTVFLLFGIIPACIIKIANIFRKTIGKE